MFLINSWMVLIWQWQVNGESFAMGRKTIYFFSVNFKTNLHCSITRFALCYCKFLLPGKTLQFAKKENFILCSSCARILEIHLYVHSYRASRHRYVFNLMNNNDCLKLQYNSARKRSAKLVEMKDSEIPSSPLFRE